MQIEKENIRGKGTAKRLEDVAYLLQRRVIRLTKRFLVRNIYKRIGHAIFLCSFHFTEEKTKDFFCENRCFTSEQPPFYRKLIFCSNER